MKYMSGPAYMVSGKVSEVIKERKDSVSGGRERDRETDRSKERDTQTKREIERVTQRSKPQYKTQTEQKMKKKEENIVPFSHSSPIFRFKCLN